MGSLLMVVIGVITAFLVGISTENNRLYDKCLQEQQDLPLVKAVQICKDRVK